MKSNKEIARSIAETVYSLQSEGSYFYEHLSEEYGIVDKFAEKVLADEDHKEVMICQMTADVLADIIQDTEGFILKHSDKDHEDGVGYHPDDNIDYDFRMTDYITAIHSDPSLRAKYHEEIQESLPEKTFRIHAKFESHCYIDIKAKTQEDAYEIASEMDGGDFISNEERSGNWGIYECEDMDAK